MSNPKLGDAVETINNEVSIVERAIERCVEDYQSVNSRGFDPLMPLAKSSMEKELKRLDTLISYHKSKVNQLKYVLDLIAADGYTYIWSAEDD